MSAVEALRRRDHGASLLAEMAAAPIDFGGSAHERTIYALAALATEIANGTVRLAVADDRVVVLVDPSREQPRQVLVQCVTLDQFRRECER